MTNSSQLLVERRGHAAWLTLNRPEKFNALNYELLREMTELFHELSLDRSIGAIVITGSGEKAFCAGGDLGELDNPTDAETRRLFLQALDTLNAIRRCPQPVVAAINGVAIGAGNELVVACDFAIADESARLGQAGPRIGSAPVFGGTNALIMQIGEKRAKEVSMLCRLYTAEQALSMGWINAVASHGELERVVQQWVDEILGKSPRYLEIAKVSSNFWWDQLQTGYSHGYALLINAAGSPDMLEGIRAFREKRAPDFNRLRTSENRVANDGAQT